MVGAVPISLTNTELWVSGGGFIKVICWWNKFW